MQVVEKSNEGLSRVIAVTIPVAELNEKLEARVKEVAPQVKLKGFRPGKVPVAHVKKTFGREFMGEIINAELNETSQKALDEAKIRPAAPAEQALEEVAESAATATRSPEDLLKIEVTQLVEEVRVGVDRENLLVPSTHCDAPSVHGARANARAKCCPHLYTAYPHPRARQRATGGFRGVPHSPIA
mgnify:CR=1 FL=1